MRSVMRLALGAVILATVSLSLPAAASAESAGAPGLELHGARSYGQRDPVQLTLKVSNTSANDCGLTRTAEGSVQIVSIRRDGQELSPVLGRSFYLDGINNAVKAGMVKS